MSRPDVRGRSAVYLPGLNGLRFVAAFAVLVAHVEYLKHVLGYPDIWGWPIFPSMATRGVSLFFVLSGFLITFLLLTEYRKTGTIRVRRFYARRILRIWPLYYLIVGWSFFVMPRFVHFPTIPDPLDAPFWPKFLLYVFMLPQFAGALYPVVLGAGQAWSIGIEEQFYLFWPGILKKWAKTPLALFIGILLARWCVQGLLSALAGLLPGFPGTLADAAFKVVRWCQAEKLVLGALGAWAIVESRQKILSQVFRPSTQILAFVALIPFFAANPSDPFSDLVESFLFTLIIMNAAANPKPLVSFENGPLRYLGKISYGLYMYHFTAIGASLLFLSRMRTQGFLFEVALYAMSIALTIAFSAASYGGFESVFLRRKTRYAVIPSDPGLSDAERAALS